jgi:hypothetical protein
MEGEGEAKEEITQLSARYRANIGRGERRCRRIKEESRLLILAEIVHPRFRGLGGQNLLPLLLCIFHFTLFLFVLTLEHKPKEIKRSHQEKLKKKIPRTIMKS